MVHYKEIKMTYLIVGVPSNGSKLISRLKRPRYTQNAHLYFFILDHFQAICEIELNSHTKSYKSHPKLGSPVVISPIFRLLVIAGDPLSPVPVTDFLGHLRDGSSRIHDPL